jgi:hypothetical protein
MPCEGRTEKGIQEIVTFKTHKVFIGDICYALNDDIYQNIWGDILNFKDGVINTKDGKTGDPCAVVGSTAYGDGGYKGSDGKVYGVDAGVIGVTDIENWRLADLGSDDTSLEDLGTIVEIPNGEATVSFKDSKGDFDITIKDASGNEIYSVSIPTSYSEDDNFDEEEPTDWWEEDEEDESDE